MSPATSATGRYDDTVADVADATPGIVAPVVYRHRRPEDR